MDDGLATAAADGRPVVVALFARLCSWYCACLARSSLSAAVVAEVVVALGCLTECFTEGGFALDVIVVVALVFDTGFA